jgi:branched-chain amino acid transport system ATP-binding protein
MLEVDDLVVDFGPKRVLTEVSLRAEANGITALVGHNGAGKTTLLRTILGLVKPQSGSVRLFGEAVTGRSTAEIARSGIAYVPQGRHVFRDLSVDENLRIGYDARVAGARQTATIDDVFEMFPIMRERMRQPARALSGGQQQMVALAMALLRNPRLMMLDEPSTGLSPVLVDQVFETACRIRDTFGVGLVIVDQNVNRLIQLGDRTFVLKAGRIVGEGTASDFEDVGVLWSLF